MATLAKRRSSPAMGRGKVTVIVSASRSMDLNWPAPGAEESPVGSGAEDP